MALRHSPSSLHQRGRQDKFPDSTPMFQFLSQRLQQSQSEGECEERIRV